MRIRGSLLCLDAGSAQSSFWEHGVGSVGLEGQEFLGLLQLGVGQLGAPGAAGCGRLYSRGSGVFCPVPREGHGSGWPVKRSTP